MKKDFYSIKEILDKAKETYSIVDYSDDESLDKAIIRQIQRYTQANVKEEFRDGKTKYFSHDQVLEMLSGDNNLIKYLQKQVISDNSESDKLKKLKEEKELNEYNILREKAYQEARDAEQKRYEDEVKEMEELGLTEEEYSLIHLNPHYLSCHELRLLNKKGVVKLKDISDEEVYKIKLDEEYTEQVVLSAESLDRRIEDINFNPHKDFEEKRLKVMIEALFSEEYELNSDLLLSDLKTKSWLELEEWYSEYDLFFEEFSLLITDYEQIKSIKRLKDNSNYYKPIDSHEDEDDEDYDDYGEMNKTMKEMKSEIAKLNNEIKNIQIMMQNLIKLLK